MYFILDEKSVTLHNWNRPGTVQSKVLMKVKLTPFGSVHLTHTAALIPGSVHLSALTGPTSNSHKNGSLNAGILKAIWLC